MRIILFLFILISTFSFAQDKTPVKRDPYLQPSSPAQPKPVKPEDKIKIIHADESRKTLKNMRESILYGNVQIEHQGSVLTADEVFLYSEENFVKAIGNTRLQNADGSVITAGEMEYDGNTQKVLPEKCCSYRSKQTIKTDILYYRQANQAYFNTGGTITDSQGNVMYTKSATYFLNTK
jgi:lipopolysaccharide assembly outer membrane protein LptD (OstA)